MKNNAKKIELTSVDDLFAVGEQIVNIELSKLHPFPNHPFKVKDDMKMMQTVESIQQYGVLVPIIVRPDKNDKYEIISGHRRNRGCELAGLSKIPAIVKNYNDDEAVIVMVDSNIQREDILISEKAFAYKMKFEALKHQGVQQEDTLRQVGAKPQRTTEKIGKDAGESSRQVERYIQLTELTPDLLDMVDNKKIAFNPAVEISYLKENEQKDLFKIMHELESTPSLSQAQRLKKFSQDEKLSVDVMSAIMTEEKKAEKDKVIFEYKDLKKYFPKSYTPKQVQEKVIFILDSWAKAVEKKRQNNKVSSHDKER